jgi:hypothetical protein
MFDPYYARRLASVGNFLDIVDGGEVPRLEEIQLNIRGRFMPAE